MQTPELRTRPVWKSTRPDDPSGNLSENSPSALSNKYGRLRVDVQVSGKAVLVDALTLCDEDLSSGRVKQKLEDYIADPKAANVVELVVVFKAPKANGDCSDQLLHLSQVQMLYVQESPWLCLQPLTLTRLLDMQPRPVLLADSPVHVETLLRTHLAHTTSVPPPQRPAVSLLSHATAAAPRRPLSALETATLHGIFASIKELETGTRTSDGRALIGDFFNPATTRDVIDFWEDEYLAT